MIHRFMESLSLISVVSRAIARDSTVKESLPGSITRVVYVAARCAPARRKPEYREPWKTEKHPQRERSGDTAASAAAAAAATCAAARGSAAARQREREAELGGLLGAPLGRRRRRPHGRRGTVLSCDGRCERSRRLGDDRRAPREEWFDATGRRRRGRVRSRRLDLGGG